MNTLNDMVLQHLEDDEVRYYELALNRIQSEFASYVAIFEGDDCFIMLHLRVVDSDLRIESSAGLKVPLDRMDQVLRYISCVNHNLRLGQFSVDSSTQELVFLVGASFEDGELSRRQWKRLVGVSIHVMNGYYLTLVQLLHEGREVPDPEPCGTRVTSEELDLAVEKLLKGLDLGLPSPEAEAATDASPSECGDEDVATMDASESAGTDADALPAPKRGRGRPRKTPPADPVATPAQDSTVNPSPKRPRGRPRKYPLPEGVGSGAVGTAPLLAVKRGRGRPRKHPLPVVGTWMPAPEVKRGRGRPRKYPLPPA